MATPLSIVTLGLLVLTTWLVNAEIRFNVSPQSTGVLLGKDLVLDCVARETSGVPLQYNWEFNSSPSPQPLLPNNSLYVAQIARADLGEYRCGAAITGQPATRVYSTPATVVKAYIEDFTVQPVSLTAVNGSAAVFECVTGLSAPQAMVSVERDGVTFTEGRLEAGAYGSPADGDARQTSMKIVLTALTTLEGAYVCVAHNPLTGETVRSEAANLTVTVPPEAPTITISPPRNPIAPAAQPFTLPCGVQGNPAPIVRWHVGEALLVTGERLQVWENGSLHFTALREEDAGTYTCSAANVVGVAVSDPVVITVAVLDMEFVRSPSDVSVLGGQPLSLLCVPPRSVPPAHVIWYQEAAPFITRDGEFAATVRPDGTLHFKNVEVTDEGRYFCVAVNDQAVPSTRTSQTATINVHASPLILEPPVPKRVIKGQLLTLTCKVQGRPEPTVRWYKDNEELVPGTRVTFPISQMELVVRTTNKDDEGMYRCVVSNRLGNVSSASVLVFIVVPPEIVHPPEDSTMRAGSDVTVPCLVYGDPRPTVVWFKDGKELSSGGRVNISREGVLIRAVRAEDEGTYQCRAVNEGGTKDGQGLLRIELTPHLTIYPDDTFVAESQPLVLYCEGTGYPAPTYYWVFNGSKTLPTDFELQDSGRRLVVQSVGPNYTGSYECVAENVAGSDSHTVSILVTVRPQITTILGAVLVDQGSDLHLTCVVEGSPRPGVTWSVGGVVLRRTPDSRLSFPAYNELLIQYARGYNSGRYQCLAENDAGTDTTNIEVYVRETPLPPRLTSVQAVSMTSVNVTWEAAAQDENNQVTYWVIQARERISQVFLTVRQDLPPSLQSYEVSNLRPFTEYVVRVAARNNIGIGSYSATLGARTLESAPSAPRNLQMVSHNATAVTLQWEVPAETNGLIRAYQIHYRRKYEADEFEVQDVDQPSKTLERHTVSDLDPYVTYEMKVRGATIELGRHLWGEFSKPIDITTSADVPSAAPPGVQVQVLSSRSIKVSWQALPDEFHNGPLGGYIIAYRRRDVTGDFTEHRVGVGQRGYDVTGLLPWRHYDVRVIAYNLKGRGIPSDVITVRTNPEVPTGSPTDVRVSVLSESAVSVSWQPIPSEERQSAISGYAVEYENVDEPGSDTLSEDVGDPAITQLNITGLLPWTNYRIRVRGFTTQLSNGFGPSSQSIAVTTREGVPGPVQNLTFDPFPTGVRLTWEPPVTPNGVITNYVITYVIVTSETPSVTSETPSSDADSFSPLNLPRRRRDVGTQISNDTWELTTTDTNVTITGLQPQSSYAFSVVGETSAGRPSTSATGPMATIVLPPPAVTVPITRAVTTPVVTTRKVMTQAPVVATTTALPGDRETDYLPYYLGAGIGGAVLLFTILLIIVICCFKRQQNKKGVYFIPPPAFAAQTLEEMGPTDAASNTTSDRSTTQNGGSTTGTQMPSSAPTWTTSAGTQSSIAIREGLPGHSAATSAISRPQSDIHTNSSQAFPSRGIPLDPMLDLTYSSLDELRLSHLSDNRYSQGVPHLQLVPPQTGLENPAYEPDSAQDLSSAFSPNTDSTFLRSSVYTSQQDLYAQVNLSKRRKNRMKSQTAAAIAAQKNATSSMFLDTDALIKNDSVVVYDERTAL